MRWTNAFLRIIVPVLLALSVGCSNLVGDATKLPTPDEDRTMINIYRDAISGPGAAEINPADVIGLSDDEIDALCRALDLKIGHSFRKNRARKRAEESCRAAIAEHAAAVHASSRAREEQLDYIKYTRSVDTEMKVLFPRMQNPDIVVYVYPHLATKNRVPIPGYTTALPLYGRVEYRLPGEKALGMVTAPLMEEKENENSATPKR